MKNIFAVVACFAIAVPGLFASPTLTILQMESLGMQTRCAAKGETDAYFDRIVVLPHPLWMELLWILFHGYGTRYLRKLNVYTRCFVLTNLQRKARWISGFVWQGPPMYTTERLEQCICE
ncbi:hypothetical protein FRC12_008828 [Ceratobasidium sp. 428]|nr:hypothetical protein FRC12_008828 [Ceratobasidium sp. 428]